MQVAETGVLVVGGGGAGLRAAIAAHEAGAKVMLATRGKLGKSGLTARAFSDRMAFHATLPHTPPEGGANWKEHARDIHYGGGEVSDGVLAETLARESASAVEYLRSLGVPFAVDEEGRVDQFVTDGSLYPRACYTGPDTARRIEDALLGRARELKIDVFEGANLVRLARGEGSGLGALLLLEGEGTKAVTVCAGAVVLAVGGPGGAFADSVYPEGMTGEAQAAAYELGAEFVNMEFIQIGLCCTKTHLACSGSVMRAIPAFIDCEGREFLPGRLGVEAREVAPFVFAKGARWPASASNPQHMVDVAVTRERLKGSTRLDFSRNPEGFDASAFSDEARTWYESRRARLSGTPLERLKTLNPQAVKWLKGRGVDLAAGDRIEIAPSAQHFQGGVKIDERARTSVPGLYACGECAGGQHGADRPGGNALLDTQVFGRIAGEEAARASKEGKSPSGAERTFENVLKEAATGAKEGSLEVVSLARSLLSGRAGVVRTTEGLERATDELFAGKEVTRPAGVGAAAAAFNASGCWRVARMVLKAAAERKESRGSHILFAEEFAPHALPRDDERFRGWFVLRRGETGMETRFEKPRPPGF